MLFPATPKQVAKKCGGKFAIAFLFLHVPCWLQLLSSGSVFPFGIALDVTHPLFAVLLKAGEHIFKSQLRNRRLFLWLPDVWLFPMLPRPLLTGT